MALAIKTRRTPALTAQSRQRSISVKSSRELWVAFSANILILELSSLAYGASPQPPSAPASSKTTGPANRPITVPLRALATTPNYFTDGSGKAIYLTGSHTWNNLQDWGTNGSIQPLDFDAYVKMLSAHNHNFTLIWTTELTVFRGLPS